MKQSIIIASLLLIALVTTQLTAADAAAGKNKSLVCGSCHGADGNSNVDMWPNLAGQGAGYLAKQIKDFRDGKRSDPSMNAMVSALTDEDIDDIAAYFSSQTLTGGAAKEEFIELGSAIYSGGKEGVMACSGCHGPNGAGLDAAGFPQLSGQKVAYVITQLNNFKNNSRTNDGTTMMNSIAANMSDEQIKAVSNYLAGLH